MLFSDLTNEELITYTVRWINVVIATVVAGSCLSFMRWVNERHQAARFLGLGLFAATFAVGTVTRLGEPFNYRLPFYTLALFVSMYGIWGMSTYRRNP